MQKRILSRGLVLCFVAAALWLFPSCSKSSDSGASGNYLTATVAGQSWGANVNSSLNSSPAIAIVTSTSNGPYFVLLGLKAVGKDTTGIVLVFPQNIALNKTVPFDAAQGLAGAWLQPTSAGANTYNTFASNSTGGSGNLTITSIDATAKTVDGSFSGSFTPQQGSAAAVQITNGKFHCPYTTDATQAPKTNVKF